MATTATNPLESSPASSEAKVLADLEAARRRTLALVAGLSDEDLERVHSPIMSPLVWDLGHIAAYEDLWLAHRHARHAAAAPRARRLLRRVRDASRGPWRDRRARTGRRRANTCEAVRARTGEVIADRGVGDGVVCEMVLRHELQHSETMRQTLAIAGLLARRRAPRSARWRSPTRGRRSPRGIRDGRRRGGASPTTTSARATPSNRPPSASLAARSPARAGCASAKTAATSGASGGRPRAGRGGRSTTSAIIRALETGHPHAPACHVSWFEADAFARAPRRAPAHRGGVGEGGDRAPGASPGRSRRALARARWPRSAWCGSGRSTRFHGYPGFVAYPYREYSEVFFGDRLPRAPGRLVGHAPARGEPHVPQLGPAPASSDLRRRAPGRRRTMTGLPTPAPRAQPARGGERRAMSDRASVGRPGTPDEAAHATGARRRDGDPHRLASRGAHESARSPTTCSTASRDRSRNCPRSTSTTLAARSCSIRSASCPSTTRPAPSARSSRTRPSEIAAADRRGRARRARLGHRREDARAARRAARRRHARRYVPVDVTESMVRDCAEELTGEYPGLQRARRDRRLRAPSRSRARGRRAADRRVPRRHDRQLPARQPPPRAARDHAPARARATTC